jgi:hypothetical protein
MVFDTVPRWFSERTLTGLNQTPRYRLPAMPWGVDRDEIEPALRAWRGDMSTVRFLDYRAPRGLPRLLSEMVSYLAVVRHGVPSLVHVTTRTPKQATSARRPRAPPELTDPVAGGDLDLRSLCMSSISNDQSRAKDANEAMGGVSALAIRTMTYGDDIARASQQVIRKRVVLGLQAALHPHRADHAEFARIIPEKVEAFSAAGQVMMQKSGEANRQIMEHVSSEVLTVARAAVSMSRCASPADLALSQGRFASAWMARATSHVIAMGAFAMSAQAAALAPIRRTVVENSERLAG